MSSKKITRALTTLIIIAAALAGISWVLANNKKKNEEKTDIVARRNTEVAVKTATVAQKAVNTDFTANGNFTPFQQLNFASETAGRVISVLVKEGDKVRKGQTLAVIKTDGLHVDLQSAADNYQNALQDKNRFENAFKTGGVTQQQLDQAELSLKNAAFRVEQAKIKITDANIRASINGTINKRFIEPGAVLNPGTQLFELVDVSKLKLKVQVNEAQVAQLKTGDKVQVKVSVFPDRIFEGVISFIAAKSDDALNFPVEIEMANTAGAGVKAGMFATAMFHFPAPPPSLVIPRTAFTGSVSSNQVFVLTGDGTARLQQVVAGRITGDEVEILSGLREGDKVITSGQVNLSDGAKAAVIQ
ncbi:efflux RND transporter periplasmic adaptor subunit [Agriterribacter sp.]|uniref:efflux RND transporter periplasmic adaptor subunit n=1 Tax=Agriterribacter sp. TaxID=2821509 RepID=UPI002BB8FDDA|nr:efflux RND transporter periplasmic adaptor subunit [Agriterribacter sp.]HRO46628.1 efflux RND transporter periplasmic adaptor subunit [Agriterribacter sp.]HRQ17288.1 efflux RND transporter periplasmic adaptor subunit [Agriterribacter sp.]